MTRFISRYKAFRTPLFLLFMAAACCLTAAQSHAFIDCRATPESLTFQQVAQSGDVSAQKQTLTITSYERNRDVKLRIGRLPPGLSVGYPQGSVIEIGKLGGNIQLHVSYTSPAGSASLNSFLDLNCEVPHESRNVQVPVIEGSRQTISLNRNVPQPPSNPPVVPADSTNAGPPAKPGTTGTATQSSGGSLVAGNNLQGNDDKSKSAPPAAAPQISIVPTITTPLRVGLQDLTVTGLAPDGKAITNSDIFICVWTKQPSPSDSLDCRTKGVAELTEPPQTDPSTKPHASLEKKAGQVAPPDKKADQVNVKLKTPLAAGQFVSALDVVTVSSDGKTQQVVASSPLLGIPAFRQCSKYDPSNPNKHIYSDCDWMFSLIAGIEQGGLSSQAPTVDGFLRVFTRVEVAPHIDFFGAVRILSAPQQNSTDGVTSAFVDPTGTVTTKIVTSTGASIDYSLGFEFPLPDHKGYTISPIFLGGGTTPLFTATPLSFVSPAYGTVECAVLYSRFYSYFGSHGIALGSPANTAIPSGSTSVAPACLVNTNDPSTANPSTYAAVSTVAYTNQDRNAFLPKYFVGFRGIDRFLPDTANACGNLDTAAHIAPCQRGMVDILIGQDATITGGILRHPVFKVDAVHPLLIKGTSYLYLFGSFSLGIRREINLDPLVLQAGAASSSSSFTPSVNTIVLPLMQPNRDFYRYGIGLDVSCIVTKLFGKSSDCSGLSSSPASP